MSHGAAPALGRSGTTRQGEGRGSPGRKGPGCRGTYLAGQARGQQGWPDEGGGPQQHLGGRRSPQLPQRVADHDQPAEVELVREPFAFGLVQDPLIVVVSAGSEVEGAGLAQGQRAKPQLGGRRGGKGTLTSDPSALPLLIPPHRRARLSLS